MKSTMVSSLLTCYSVPSHQFRTIQTTTKSATRPATIRTPSIHTNLDAPAPECVGAAVLLEPGGAELEEGLELCAAVEVVVEATTELVVVAVDAAPDVVVSRVVGVVTVVLAELVETVPVSVAVGDPVAVVMSVVIELTAATEAAEADENDETATTAALENAVDAAEDTLWREADSELSGPIGTGTLVTTEPAVEAAEAAEPALEVAASAALVAVFAAAGL